MSGATVTRGGSGRRTAQRSGCTRARRAPWRPSELPSLYAWYRASDLALSDGTAVASWPDASGRGRTLTQATGTKQPIFHTNRVNGLPAVTFDGADDILATAATASPTAGLMVMVLCKPTAAGSTYRTAVCHQAAATWVSPFARYLLRQDGGAGTAFGWSGFVENAGVATNRVIEFGDEPLNVWQIIELSYDFVTERMFRNGELLSAIPRTAALPSSTQPLLIGNDPTGVAGFQGEIAEVIIAASDADRLAIANYLISRAGLTPLGRNQVHSLLPNGVQSKGVNIAMRNGPAVGVGFNPQCWSDMWTQWEWSAAGNPGDAGNWIKPQLDQAKALGMNTVHLLGSQYCRSGSGSAHASPISFATYAARWTQLLDYCRAIGLKAYVGFGGDSQICDFGSQYGYTPGSSWLLSEYQACATLWANYTDIIVGIDLSTEAKIWASNTANSQPIYNAVKAILPTVSLSWSNSDVNTPTNRLPAAMVPASVLDHYDVHIYYDPLQTDFDAILALGKPVLIGEFGANAGMTLAQRQQRYNAVVALANRTSGGRWMAGAQAWSMYDQDTVAANQWGLCTAAGVPRTDVLGIHQLLRT